MGDLRDILVPDIGDYRDVPVIELLVKPGDTVGKDAPLLVLESDKAAMDVPSPVSGKIVKVLVDVGTKVSHGAAIIVIETSDPVEGPPVLSSAEPAPRPQSPVAPPKPYASGAQLPGASSPSATTSAYATPSVRALARELGVDLAQVPPTGPKGRILREDVAAHVKRRLSDPGAAQRSIGVELPPWPAIDFGRFGAISKAPLSRIQKLSGGNLARNWLAIPHVTNFDRADVTALEATRQSFNKDMATGRAKLTMVAYLMKASAIALREYPRFNTSLVGDELVHKDYVHIGFAADTPSGLVVPVIRDCDRKPVADIASELAELAALAREAKLSSASMQGGCFTVSSLGGVGGDGFTPIINAPDVAILGAGRSRMEAVWNGTAFEPSLILPMSLSWDHRVVDGVAAARFLGRIASLLSDPSDVLK